jgi:hypothetical protein
LAERVAAYHSDNLNSIPASEQWDLVVGHRISSIFRRVNCVFHDEDWKLHQRSFTMISRFLKPGGIIVLLETIAVRRRRRSTT